MAANDYPDDPGIIMPSFTEDTSVPSMEDVFGPNDDSEQTTQTPLPVEELVIPPEALVIPTFTESSYHETPEESTQDVPESAAPKRRGRPRGSKNRVKSEVELNPESGITSALKRRTDQELSKRAQGILVGASHIPAVINPRIAMTPEEAQAIADPLVSYAKSHVDSERIEQFVEQWDLIAVGVASAAYAMRVVKETSNDRRERSGNVRQLPRQRSEASNGLPFHAESQGQPEPSIVRNAEDAIVQLPPSEPIVPGL